jgi:integrase
MTHNINDDDNDRAQNPGRSPKNRRSRLSDCRYRLTGLLAEHGHLSYDGVKRISFGTIRSRSFVLLQGFAYLNEVGMCPRNPENFKPKHMARLVGHWEEEGLAASTLQLRFSIFSTFCNWIGKPGMLGDIDRYLKDPSVAKRTYVATEDKSWSAKGVDFQTKVAEVAAIHPHAAMTLKVMHAFAVRIEEAVSLHPNEADLGNALWVAWGTKGGRKRPVRIENTYQRQVLDEAKTFASRTTKSLVPETYKKRDTWIKRCYEIFNACGISRKHGIVPHGLRHQRANDMYENLTGQKSPVRGGNAPTDKKADRHARRIIAEELGHGRPEVVGMYAGSKSRKKSKPEEK